MAAEVPIFTYMRDTLGFPVDVASAIVNDGLDNFDAITTLKDDEITMIVKNIRRPRGYMPRQVDAAGVELPNQARKCQTAELMSQNNS
jgi:hypothetical protein